MPARRAANRPCTFAPVSPRRPRLPFSAFRAFALKSFVCSDPLTTWGEATVFLPINAVDAAYVVPPSARNSASMAIVFRRRKRPNPLVI